MVRTHYKHLLLHFKAILCRLSTSRYQFKNPLEDSLNGIDTEPPAGLVLVPGCDSCPAPIHMYCVSSVEMDQSKGKRSEVTFPPVQKKEIEIEIEN